MGVFRLKWDLEEEVLLVDLYHSLKTVSNDERIQHIRALSQMLNYRAKVLGIKIDSKYRNVEGIKMKLQNIEYFDSNGKHGLSSVSDLGKRAFLLYIENPNEFEKILEETKSKYNILLESLANEDCGAMECFKKWLAHIGISPKSIDGIMHSIDDINQYAKSTRKVYYDIYKITKIKELNRVIKILTSDKFFRIKNKMCNNSYVSSMQIYLKYIKQIEAGKVISVNAAPSELTESEPVKNVFADDSIFQNVSGSNSQDKFFNWMLKVQELSIVSARSYSSAIKRISELAVEKGITDDSLFVITSTEQIKSYIQMLYDDSDFNNTNATQHNRFTAALNHFYKFASRDMQADYSVAKEEPIQVIKNESKSAYSIHNKVDYEGLQITSQLKLQYLSILSNYFSRGFKLNSVIDTKKFRMFYQEKFGSEVMQDDTTISEILSHICIEYNSGHVMSPEKAINESILNEILVYITESFSNGKNAIYFEGIYTQFKEKLIDTNVYNSKVLKQVLNFYVGDKYYFKRSYIAINAKVEVDPAAEIKKLLVSNTAPMSTDEMIDKLPHITMSKINQALRQAEFICVDRNCYMHVDRFDISQKEYETIKCIIQNWINEHGYVLSKGLYKYLEKVMPEFVEKYNISTPTCLKNVLAYYLVNDFDFSRGVISPKGEDLSVAKIFSEYFSDKNTFKLSDLNNLANELDMIPVHGAYVEGILENFIRISADDFLRKGKIHFDSQQVDLAIEKFCTSSYIPIVSIDRYAIFPSVGIPWNTYLLDSYVRNYSNKFVVMSSSFSVNKCIGAVVKKATVFSNYDELLADAVANAPSINVNDTTEVIQYLYNCRYIGSRRLKTVEVIVNIARRKQQEKAM